MNGEIIKGVKGFDDVFDKNYSVKSRIASMLMGKFNNWGYVRVEAPLFESTELFLRKSGGELASRLYRLKDSSVGDVSVRPEFTSSVIRSLIGQGLDDRSPRRVLYSGSVYRRPLSDTADEKETMQVGVELLGSEGLLGDSEIISMVLAGLETFNINKAIFKLNNLEMLFNLLDSFSLSDRAKLFIMANLEALKNDSAKYGIDQLWIKAQKEGLVSRDDKTIELDSNERGNDSRSSIRKHLSEMENIWIGRRSSLEVEKRYIDKFDNDQDPKVFHEALSFMGEFAKLAGTGMEVIEGAKGILTAHGISTKFLENLKDIVAMLDSIPLSGEISLEWDMGFAPGLSYYSGLVFQVTTDEENRPPICVGGRYDGLTKALGGVDFPALGFAYSVDSLLSSLSSEQIQAIVAGDHTPNKTIVVQPRNHSDIGESIRWAEHLRAEDVKNVVILGGFIGKQNLAQEYAVSVGAEELIFVDGDNHESVLLKRDV
ncbi:MAG: ATP phosphoribosyltransferase regulatory subunit [Chloroflexota bacterium]|nr:ATP phosphoribosyltransferase regulatory subunit [Chloroflexota bacterium]